MKSSQGYQYQLGIFQDGYRLETGYQSNMYTCIIGIWIKAGKGRVPISGSFVQSIGAEY